MDKFQLLLECLIPVVLFHKIHQYFHESIDMYTYLLIYIFIDSKNISVECKYYIFLTRTTYVTLHMSLDCISVGGFGGTTTTQSNVLTWFRATPWTSLFATIISSRFVDELFLCV